MGIWAWLGLTGSMSEARVAKASKLAANPFAQPEVRMREMQRLIKDGTPLALRGVLKRFASNAQGHIADEEEKRFLSDALVAAGSVVLAPLEDYIVSEAKLTWALGTYRRVAQEARATEFFIEVLLSIGPADHRRTEAKEQLVRELGEHTLETGVIAALTPFLLDHADEVRSSVLEVLSRVPDGPIETDRRHKQALVDTLGALISQEQVSLRVAQSAARLLAQRGWAVGEQTGSMNQALSEGYFMDKKRQSHARVAG